MTFEDIRAGQVNATRDALALLSAQPIILDTETTRLDDHDEICKIAIIDQRGATVLDVRVRPTGSIPADAKAIHGISDDDVRTSPTFGQVWVSLVRIGYGAPPALAIHNAMEMYARFWGSWSEYHGTYTWQSLENTAMQQRLYWEGEPHSAMRDALMYLRLLERMEAAH